MYGLLNVEGGHDLRVYSGAHRGAIGVAIELLQQFLGKVSLIIS